MHLYDDLQNGTWENLYLVEFFTISVNQKKILIYQQTTYDSIFLPSY